MDIIWIILIVQLGANLLLGYRLREKHLEKYIRWSYSIYIILALLSFLLPGILTISSTIGEFGAPDAVSGPGMFLTLTIGLLTAVTIGQLIFNKVILRRIRG